MLDHVMTKEEQAKVKDFIERFPAGDVLITHFVGKTVTVPKDNNFEDCGLCGPQVIPHVCSRCVQAFGHTYGGIPECVRSLIWEHLLWLNEMDRARLFKQSFLAPQTRPVGNTDLVAYRRALGLTQKELAKRWHMSRSRLAMMERGSRPVSKLIQKVVGQWRMSQPHPTPLGPVTSAALSL